MKKDAATLGMDLYIVITANTFELAYKEDCIDAISGDHVTFESYDQYREFILASREEKNRR